MKLYLPAVGCLDEMYTVEVGTGGYYTTSSSNEYDLHSYILCFYPKYICHANFVRYLGSKIRNIRLN